MVEVNPLREIETILGGIETWPSEIIKLIFIEEYKCISSNIIFLRKQGPRGLGFEILLKM